MTVNYPLTVFLLFLGPVAQGAATGNPGFMSPGTPGSEAAKPDPNHYNLNDVQFLHRAAQSNHGEVALAKLAQERTRNESVGRFAAMMNDDHTRANGQLMAIRGELKLDRPAHQDPEHDAAEKGLQQDDDPDREYIATEIMDHQKTANLLLWELSTGQNAKLLDYSRQTLPAVLMHLEAAKQIQEAMAQTPR